MYWARFSSSLAVASLVMFGGVGDISVSPWVSDAPVPEASDPEETPTPLPEPPLPPEPPPAFVYIAGIAHRATVGTYCWFPFGCVDAIGVIAPREPPSLAGVMAAPVPASRGWSIVLPSSGSR